MRRHITPTLALRWAVGVVVLIEALHFALSPAALPTSGEPAYRPGSGRHWDGWRLPQRFCFWRRQRRVSAAAGCC